ncbi:putative asparagine synthase [Mycena floridula]|nr:putative asparagine synthase [Mycena floridula]
MDIKMCGVIACYSTCSSGDKVELHAQLSESITTIDHRGPDSRGIYVTEDGHVGLGHVRLSIIDLEGGQQPMHVDHVHAIVNGELYDYKKLREELESQGCKFQTSCDSELVLHLYKIYGQNLFFHLRGEFAFVLYDSQKDLLIAARDRFGIKPLYYTMVDGRLLLASEMKAFPPLGWNPKWDVDSIVNMGEYNDDRTVFKGVYKLPPATFLTFRRTGQLKIQHYWDQSYPHRQKVETRTIEEMIQGVRDRLVDSVRARLRSDVPLGVYLSGGIDSAAVAGIAAQLLKEQDPDAKLTTFTLAFPGRADLDEGPIAQRMAESIGANIHMIAPSEQDLVNYFEKCVYHTETPVIAFHGAGKIILSEFVRQHGYKVVMTGEGSDEIFGGYSFLLPDYLRATDLASTQLGIPLPNSTELAAILEGIESTKLPQDHTSLSNMSFTDSPLARAMMGGLSAPRFWASHSLPTEIFSPEVLAHVGPVDRCRTVAEGIRAEVREKSVNSEWHPLNTSLYTVTNTLLSRVLLNVLGERSEMASSIEGRPPFLDHHVVEYANQLPPSLKVKPHVQDGKWSFTEKWVVREAVKPFVTEEIYLRKKSQYNAPIARVTNGSLTPLQRLLKERLTVETVGKLGWANWDCISGLLHQYLESPETPLDGGLDKRARVLLCIVSFVILQDRFKVPTAEIQ